MSLKLVPSNPELVQLMAWRRPGNRPSSGPMKVSLQMLICVTRPQWVKRYCEFSKCLFGQSIIYINIYIYIDLLQDYYFKSSLYGVYLFIKKTWLKYKGDCKSFTSTMFIDLDLNFWVILLILRLHPTLCSTWQFIISTNVVLCQWKHNKNVMLINILWAATSC